MMNIPHNYGKYAPENIEYMKLGALSFSSVKAGIEKLEENGVENPDWYLIEVNNAITENTEFIKNLIGDLEKITKKTVGIIGGEFPTWSLLVMEKGKITFCIRNRHD